MLENFATDLEKGKRAEVLVADTFKKLTNDYTFVNVGDVQKFYYKGDIKAIDKDGNEIFIEVKNDSRIAETGRVLCEEEVYYKNVDYYGKGNMEKSDSDIYIVVSEQARKMYIFDFKILQKIYTKGEYREINHPAQTTYCYLLDICDAKRYGALIKILKY